MTPLQLQILGLHSVECNEKIKINSEQDRIWKTPVTAFLLRHYSCTVVRVFAIGSKVREFKHGRGRWFLGAIEICSTTSFGWEANPSVPCCKGYGKLKYPTGMQEIIHKQSTEFLSPSSCCFASIWLLVELPDSSARQNRMFPCRHHSTVDLHAGGWTIGPLVAAVQRHNLAPLAWTTD
jgi:hypothetical protein